MEGQMDGEGADSYISCRPPPPQIPNTIVV